MLALSTQCLQVVASQQPGAGCPCTGRSVAEQALGPGMECPSYHAMQAFTVSQAGSSKVCELRYQQQVLDNSIFVLATLLSHPEAEPAGQPYGMLSDSDVMLCSMLNRVTKTDSCCCCCCCLSAPQLDSAAHGDCFPSFSGNLSASLCCALQHGYMQSIEQQRAAQSASCFACQPGPAVKFCCPAVTDHGHCSAEARNCGAYRAPACWGCQQS